MLHRLLRLYIDSFSGLQKDVWILSLMTLINRAGTMVIPFLSIYLTDQLGFSLRETGFVMSCWGLGALAGSLLGGFLTDKLGYYRVMFWTLLLSGFGYYSLMYFHTFIPFCFAIFIVTTIAESFRPASMASLGAYSKPENRTRSLSLLRLAINLGFGLGSALGGIIAGKFGYDWLFIIEGITFVAAAFFFITALKEKEDREKDLMNAPLEEGKFVSAYQDVQFLFFIALMFTTCIAFMQIFTIVPIYLKSELGFTEIEFGLLLAYNCFLIVILEMPIIYLVQERFHRVKLITIGTLIFGLAFVAFFLPFNIWAIAIIMMTAFTLGEIVHFPISSSIVLDRSSPFNRGQYMGAYGMAFSIAFIIAPILGTEIATIFGFKALWAVMAGICLFTALGYVGIRLFTEVK